MDDFYVLFAKLRIMVQEYLFGGALIQMSQYAYVFGYQDPRIQYLFAEKSVQEGKEVHLDDNISILTNELSAVVMNQTAGMYTGAIKKDQTSKIRFINGKNYLNKKLNIFDGNKINSLTVSPTSALQSLDDLYNGMQFAPNSNDSITFFDHRYLMQFQMNEKEDMDFFTSSSGPHIKVKQYTAQTQDNGLNLQAQFAFNQPILVSVSDHTIKINPELGLLVERTLNQKQSLQIPSASMAVADKSNNIVLPLPSLDSKAGQVMDLVTVQESLTVNQQKYNGLFDYVYNRDSQIKTASIIFLSLMIISALIFVGVMIFYCINLRKVDSRESEKAILIAKHI